MTESMVEEIRNEIARREEAGFDARVPFVGPAKFKKFTTNDLRAMIQAALDKGEGR